MYTPKKLRIVACCCMRDEERIVEKWLQRTCEFADGIVVLDDGSTDRTSDIVSACPKVIELLRNPQGGMGVTRRSRNRLLKAARAHGAEWLMIIDADEIMDARLADRLDELLSRPDVGRIFFREVTLWRSNKFYRVDRPDMYFRDTGTNQIVRMTPGLRWVLPARYTLRRRLLRFVTTHRLEPAPVVGNESLAGIQGTTLKVTDLVRIHYHFAAWERAWRLHLRYAARDAIQFKRRPRELPQIVTWATARLDETGLQLAPVKAEWGVL